MKKGSYKNNLIGKRFGKLIVLDFNPPGHWICRCDCGNIVNVDTRNLNSGHTQSCGCLAKEKASENCTDMIGYENIHLKVISKAESTKEGTARWLCQCKCCGETFITTGSRIRLGYGCKNCPSITFGFSLNESCIENELKKNNIPYKREYTFSDLRSDNGYKLKFDFAIFDEDGKLSHLIEYNDPHHYIRTPKTEYRLACDKKKYQYCKEHNIDMKIITGTSYTISDLIKNNKKQIIKEPVEAISQPFWGGE